MEDQNNKSERIVVASQLISIAIGQGFSAAVAFGSEEAILALQVACIEQLVKTSLLMSSVMHDTDAAARARFVKMMEKSWDDSKPLHDAKRAEFSKMMGGLQ